ncbi:MAG: OsmC family protein [Ferruginibacter sp.]
MDIHFVTTSFDEDVSFTAYINSHPVKMDSSGNLGSSPKRLMLASLAGCTGVDIVLILDKMKVAYSDFSIDTEATLTETDPKIYNWVKLTYKIKLEEKDHAKMERAVSLSQDKYCGVSAMFKAFATVETEIVYL